MGLNNLRAKAKEKADHKFEKKVQFYSKVRSQTIAATQTTKTKSKTNSSSIDNSKSRQKLLLREGKQFESVVSHPAFNSDPFGAIHQHLHSTQPVIEAPKEKEKKKKGTNGKTKKRAKKRAASSRGHQLESMEI